jgi:Flp pilus assembly protein TadG
VRRFLRRLRGDGRAVAALEFAIGVPIVLLFLLGMARLGILYMANAGLRSAVAEGARLATIYPLPSDEQLRQRIMDSRFGLQQANMTQPTIVHGTINGSSYVDITAQYAVPMDFVLFQLPAVILVERRRAFVSPSSPATPAS